MAGSGCRRPLHTQELAEDFVEKVFRGPDNAEDIANIAIDIVNAELTIDKLEESPTITHSQYRTKEYRTNPERERLRQTILKELINDEQLSCDDEIKLGRGGAKPRVPKNDRQAYIVSGTPASGKSTIANQLANEHGAFILDSDYAKRKFPEYDAYCGGASLVHEESDKIVFGAENSLFEYCIYGGNNIVMPLVGKTLDSVEKICCRLISSEYDVHIINVVLDRYKCTSRAYDRYKKTDRYVPLSYIFDEVGNEPERIYFLLKRKHQGEANYASFTQVSTDVPKGTPPTILEDDQMAFSNHELEMEGV